MVAKKLKQKIIFYYTSMLSFSLACSHHQIFFFFAYFSLARYFLANDSKLSSFFRFGIRLDCVFYPMCQRLVEIWQVPCTVQKTCKYISHKKTTSKMGFMILFTYLKIILLHLKMVYIRLQIKKLVYFTIQLIFVTIYGPYCIFYYYSYVSLYYFN